MTYPFSLSPPGLCKPAWLCGLTDPVVADRKLTPPDGLESGREPTDGLRGGNGLFWVFVWLLMSVVTYNSEKKLPHPNASDEDNIQQVFLQASVSSVCVSESDYRWQILSVFFFYCQSINKIAHRS